MNDKLKNLGLADKNDQKINYDVEIGHDDIRYQTLCATYAPILREELSKQMKPKHIHMKSVIELGNFLKPAFLLLSMVFIFLGRPEWCANKGT